MSKDAVHVTGQQTMKVTIYRNNSGRDVFTCYMPNNGRVNAYFAQYLAVVDSSNERFEFDIDPYELCSTPTGSYRGVVQNDCTHYHAEGSLNVYPSALPTWSWDPPSGSTSLYFVAGLDRLLYVGGYRFQAWWFLDNPKFPLTQTTRYGDVSCRVEPEGQNFVLIFSYRNRQNIPIESKTGKFTRIGSFTVGNNNYKVDELRAEIRRQLGKPYNFEEFIEYSIEHDSNLAFGNLALRAADSVRFTNINGLAYVKDAVSLSEFAKVVTDVGDLGETLADIVKTAKAEYPRAVKRVITRTKAGKAVKLASSAYLAIHYGAKLGYQDTLSLASSLDDLSDGIGYDIQTIGSQQEGTLKFGTSDLDVTTRLTAYVDRWSQPQGFFLERLNGIKRAAYELDVAPTLANIWDLLPWTFVIDWFLPVGDIAERMELESYMQTFNVQQCFCSYRAQWESDQLSLYGFEGVAVTGKVRYRFYKRMCRPTLPKPPPPDLNFPLKDLPRHFVEGTALTISRLKR